MELSKFSSPADNGSIVVTNWPLFYADKVSVNRNDLPESQIGHLSLIDGKWCLHDYYDRPILNSGVTQEDLETLYDISSELLKDVYWIKRYDRKVYWRFGVQAAAILRERRENEEEYKRQLQRDALFLNPENPNDGYTPEREDIHIVKSADEWLRIGKSEPERKTLWLDIWNEKEICILFADSNIGKSIYAVQMGCHIAETHKVVYFDYEMDAHDFSKRFCTPGTERFTIPSNFRRCQPDSRIFLSKDAENVIMMDIERVVRIEKPEVIIIDNITFISANSQNSKAALILMYKLKLLQNKYNLAILVLAHTPKRNNINPITQNDMAGSKKLLNFIDSCFTIAQSAVDPGIQYLKQIKARGGEIRYNTNNVLLMQRTFSDGWLHFESRHTDSEYNHLKGAKIRKRMQFKEKLTELSNVPGLSQRDIATLLGTSASTVNRLLKSHANTEVPDS